MKNALKNSDIENMCGLLDGIFMKYANDLRRRYPDQTIRNVGVFETGICEFSRLGYVQLVDGSVEIPREIPDLLVRTIKQTKHQPIWVPGNPRIQPGAPASRVTSLRTRGSDFIRSAYADFIVAAECRTSPLALT